jgi:hypothetical protein
MGKVLGSIPSKSTFFLEVLVMFLHVLVAPERWWRVVCGADNLTDSVRELCNVGTGFCFQQDIMVLLR